MAHNETQPPNPAEYEAKLEQRIRPETLLAIDSLYTVVMALETLNGAPATAEAYGRVKSRKEIEKDLYEIRFIFWHPGLGHQIGPGVATESHDGLWIPKRHNFVVFNGRPVREGCFIDSLEGELQTMANPGSEVTPTPIAA